ncbi:hypothetical protein V6N13_110902 [Hibiscus sabdariffa]
MDSDENVGSQVGVASMESENRDGEESKTNDQRDSPVGVDGPMEINKSPQKVEVSESNLFGPWILVDNRQEDHGYLVRWFN